MIFSNGETADDRSPFYHLVGSHRDCPDFRDRHGAGAVGATASPSAVPTVSLLDGKTFVAQSGGKGKQASNKDTIVFRDGRFFSEGCSPYNFKDAPYQAIVDGAAIHFHAETHSPTHGTMVWDGTVKDNAIEATSVWTRERWYWKIKKEYWYRGQLKSENRGE